MIEPESGKSIDEQDEAVVIRLLGWGEARGEGALGVLAVLHVVRNRALHRKTSMKIEALRPKQFSCFNEGDPNRGKMLSAVSFDPRGWGMVDGACALLESGTTADPTHGALNYFVSNMPNPPAWSRPETGWTTTAVIGRHTFGNAGA